MLAPLEDLAVSPDILTAVGCLAVLAAVAYAVLRLRQPQPRPAAPTSHFRPEPAAVAPRPPDPALNLMSMVEAHKVEWEAQERYLETKRTINQILGLVPKLGPPPAPPAPPPNS